MEHLELTGSMAVIAEQILREIRSRLRFLQAVGLSYLTLSRAAGTLSGGESQRIRLATQIGSSLMGVLYILDEPSIGLHQRDNDKLLDTLRRLRDLGNSVLVVEHDEDTMRAADFIVDVGPGAGIHGGEIVAAGSVGRYHRRAPLHHRPVSLRRKENPRARPSGARETAKNSKFTARRKTICSTWMCRSRSERSSA